MAKCMTDMCVCEDNQCLIDPALVASKVKSFLKKDVIKELVTCSFQDPQTTLDNDALNLVVEVAKCLVLEACLRTTELAISESEGKKVCEVIDHILIQKCLPQLMLDFP